MDESIHDIKEIDSPRFRRGHSYQQMLERKMKVAANAEIKKSLEALI